MACGQGTGCGPLIKALSGNVKDIEVISIAFLFCASIFLKGFGMNMTQWMCRVGWRDRHRSCSKTGGGTKGPCSGSCRQRGFTGLD